MANTPIPKAGAVMPPRFRVSGDGAWGGASDGVRQVEPIVIRGTDGDSAVKVDKANIMEVRENSQFKGASRWSAGEISPENVALSMSNLDSLEGQARAELRDLLGQRLPSFHAFINGDVAPYAISQLLLEAEQIVVSAGPFERIEDFLGEDVVRGDFFTEHSCGIYKFPSDDDAAGIARALGWNEDRFANFVRMARVANHEKWAANSGEILSLGSKNMERLYRMLRYLQEKAAIPDADALIQMIIARNGTSDRITMQDLVCIYGKAIAEDLDFFDIIEVLLNATWADEAVLVSRKASEGAWLAGDNWYEDEEDHMHVYSGSMAEAAAAYMYGPNMNLSQAAIMYSILGEQHLHNIGPTEGRYYFYERELYRKEARNDFKNNPEEYYDGVKPRTEMSLDDIAKGVHLEDGVLNEGRSLARLREIFAGTDFEDEVGRITDVMGFIEPKRALFRDMALDVSWVTDVAHYARATLYALLAAARFNEAGEAAMAHDRSYARVSFDLARRTLEVFNERGMVMQYLEGQIRDGVVFQIIQPFDMMKYNDLFKRIKRNQRRVSSRKGPPPRRRRKS